MNRNSSMLVNKPVIAISAAASPLARLTNEAIFVQDGRLGSVAAGNLPALTTEASLAAGERTIVLFIVNSAGVVSNLYGTKATALANVVVPTVNPNTHVLLGGVLLTATGAFTGGVTALDAGAVTARYFDADNQAISNYSL